jgi:hypothetical protein
MANLVKIRSNGIEEFDYELVIDNIRKSTFRRNEKYTREIIDEYISFYPMLLNIHDKEWYYKYC